VAKAQMAAQPDNIMMLMMLVLPVATEAGAYTRSLLSSA